ncbi:HEPN domain-containing protein [Sphingomonas kyeonggiensis]|uniref:HEPN domain-containing protein n=1 Tax=Sphingomonas kyeonggiensis TaxID=1268553 RepID=A0A7W6JVS0_9SPHN|nr:HEPN domain-containing protein [Sphingomonas kyeonggiensis]
MTSTATAEQQESGDLALRIHPVPRGGGEACVDVRQSPILARLVRDRRKNAAFQLHQATERLYHCVLLTLTFYTPHVHNLAFLRTQAERLDPRLRHIWPMATKRERAMFEKLKDAYVKARFSKHYRIDAEELAWLGERVEELSQAVKMICSGRIKQLEQVISR